MTVRRIVAPTAREALRRVKEELGPDAIVVANKPVADGVEITAMSPDSLDALAAQTTGRPPAEPTWHPPAGVTEPAGHDVDDDYTVTLSAKAHAQTPFRPWQPPASATPARWPSTWRDASPERSASTPARRRRPPPPSSIRNR